MSKIAYIFAGQGAQYKGMGEDLYNNYSQAKKIFDQASEIFEKDMPKLCFKSDENELAKTGNAQPAIFTHSLAAFKVLQSHLIELNDLSNQKGYAGFSLGECTALTAVNALSIEDGFYIIKARAKAMQEAAERSEGAMAAIMGLDAQKINEICQNTPGIVRAVNYNSPNQTVIAGEETAVKNATSKLIFAGAKRAMPLKVNAAFHTPLMAKAATDLKLKISHFKWQKEKHGTIYSNTTAKPFDWNNPPAEYLSKQITMPVLWEKLINQMIEDGYTKFIEFGPKRTLSGFIKRINNKVSLLNIDNSSDVEKTLEILLN